MNAVSQDFDTALAESIEAATFLQSTPEDEAARMADIHRAILKKHETRIVETRNGLKAALATLAALTKAEKQRHAEAMAEISERTSEAREVARRDIAADLKVVAKSHAWLKTAE